MLERDYRGIAALVIAGCAAIGIFIVTPVGVVVISLWLGQLVHINESTTEVMIALGGALVGSMATYMGMKYEYIGKYNGREGRNERSKLPPHTDANQASKPGLQPPARNHQTPGQLEQGQKDAGPEEGGPA